MIMVEGGREIKEGLSREVTFEQNTESWEKGAT